MSRRPGTAILNTPLGLSDVVAGELFWAATKSLFSGAAILVVITALGLTHGPLLLWALPAIVLTGLAFAALGLIWNALARPTTSSCITSRCSSRR